MATITLSTRKEVKTRELNAYQNFLMSDFITGTIDSTDAESGKIPASIGLQMSTLTTLFSVVSVNGEDAKTPTNRKELVEAFSRFSQAELQELSTKIQEGNDKLPQTGEKKLGS